MHLIKIIYRGIGEALNVLTIAQLKIYSNLKITIIVLLMEASFIAQMILRTIR